MNKSFYALAAFMLLAGTVNAQLHESFNYPDGNLTSVSGGKWEKWDPSSSGDATVTGGVAKIEDTTDVVSFFNNVFAGGNTHAAFSFDLNMTTGNSIENYQMFFGSSSSPAGDPINGTNYSSGLTLVFDPAFKPAPDPGTAYVAAVDLNGGVIFAEVPVQTTLTFTGDMMYNPALGIVNYNLSIDGIAVYTSSFLLQDPRGLNSLEFYNSSDVAAGTTDPNASATLDNINIAAVPEPASIAAISTGLIGLLGIARKRRNA